MHGSRTAEKGRDYHLYRPYPALPLFPNEPETLLYKFNRNVPHVLMTNSLICSMDSDGNKNDLEIDRASAFRLAMLAILDDPAGRDATFHPSYWAPFTLLGESR